MLVELLVLFGSSFVSVKVSAEEGTDLARQFGVPFYETSAAWRQCVDDVFHGLVREIRRKERETSSATEKHSRRQNRIKRVQAFFKRMNFFKREGSADRT